jgi:hypothetical protein
MDKDRRKDLIKKYKQRKTVGGIYRVSNTRNDMFLLGFSPNIRAKQNAFEFMASSDSCFDYRLKKDRDAFGSKVFTFEILETLERKDDQTQEQFIDDLKTLAQIWSDRFDSSKRY